MAGWAGFSEEELRRIQNAGAAGPFASGRGRRAANTNRSRQQLQREKALQLAVQSTAASALLTQQQLSKPAQQPESPQGNPSHQTAQPDPQCEPEEPEKQQVALKEKSRLEQLQLEQRLIEEKNKRKKALLSKTIAEKSKQTQAEAVKLKRVQKELQALDDMVSNDIGILRGRIEQASWEYTAARKRYEKAEAEFVAAKMELHKKTEAKEQLTEHLYTIIQQNEQRKAHKLEELMQQLEVQADEEQLELEIHVEKMLQEEEKGNTDGTGSGDTSQPQGGKEDPQTCQEEGKECDTASTQAAPSPDPPTV